EVAKTGVGILLVEQNARQSLKISDRGYLIENGHVTGENSADALMNNPAVINAYLGGAKPAVATAETRVLPVLQTGMDMVGRLIDEVVERASNIQRLFIRSLRRKRNVPSAFAGRYDPSADEVRPEKRVPVISQEARLLSQSAGDLSRKASERLARHISSKRTSGEEVEAVEPELQSNLIGHNSRFAVEEEPVVEIAKPADTSERADMPISDGIGALVAGLATVQSGSQGSVAKASGAWPVSSGIGALIAQAAERQDRKSTRLNSSHV